MQKSRKARYWLNTALWIVLLSIAELSGADNADAEGQPGPPIPSPGNNGAGINGPDRPAPNTDSNNVTTLVIGNETYSFHPVNEGPFAVSQYSITCCQNGAPEPDPLLAPHIHEWSQEMVGTERNKTCRRFNGYYSVPSPVMEQYRKMVVGVRCKCPDSTNLDRNCRYLPDCANGGYRSFGINLRCVCPPQWFGELCDKLCLNGALYKENVPGDDGLGVDKCRCYENFYGEACDQVHCFNGGTPVKQRGCICMPPYIGPHCEESAGVGQLDQTHSSFHRDLSSAVVSLFLAVALALGVYFLVRRRTRWIRERMRARRAAMARMESGEDIGRSPQSHSGQPPTYRSLTGQQTTQDPSLYNLSSLPPPPAYNDVIKTPPTYVDAHVLQASVTPSAENNSSQSATELTPEPEPASSGGSPAAGLNNESDTGEVQRGGEDGDSKAEGSTEHPQADSINVRNHSNYSGPGRGPVTDDVHRV